MNGWKLYILYYLHRYKLQIDVEDDNDYTSFVGFNREAENLLGISALCLLEKENGEHNGGPTIFKKIHGESFIFQIRLNAYNLKDRFENYIVNKIFVLDYHLEEKFSSCLANRFVKSNLKNLTIYCT